MVSMVLICVMLLQKRKFSTPSNSLALTDWYRGLFAIKDYRDAVNQDDFNKAVRKVAESKKLEGKLEYQKL
jgi:ATP-dependent 26S proteasome regulatory subunit